MEWVKFFGVTVCYALLSSYGLFLLKTAELSFNVRLIFGILAYGAGFVVWLGMLRLFELSVAFPVAAGSLVIATQLFGLLLGEQWLWSKGVGVFFVVLGITFISMGMK